MNEVVRSCECPIGMLVCLLMNAVRSKNAELALYHSFNNVLRINSELVLNIQSVEVGNWILTFCGWQEKGQDHTQSFQDDQAVL